MAALLAGNLSRPLGRPVWRHRAGRRRCAGWGGFWLVFRLAEVEEEASHVAFGETVEQAFRHHGVWAQGFFLNVCSWQGDGTSECVQGYGRAGSSGDDARAQLSILHFDKGLLVVLSDFGVGIEDVVEEVVNVMKVAGEFGSDASTAAEHGVAGGADGAEKLASAG